MEINPYRLRTRTLTDAEMSDVMARHAASVLKTLQTGHICYVAKAGDIYAIGNSSDSAVAAVMEEYKKREQSGVIIVDKISHRHVTAIGTDFVAPKIKAELGAHVRRR